MALRPQTSLEKQERIKSAPQGVTNGQLAEELELSERTVIRYRMEARRERQEIAREVVARHVEENVGDALADLHDLRKLARQKYETAGDSRDGNLWLSAIKTTLEHVKPDDADLDAAITADLEKLDAARQRTAAAAGAGRAAASLAN